MCTRKMDPELEQALKELKNEIQQAKRPATEVILDDVDLRNLLKVSKRTCADWREKKLIKFSKIQGKIFYKLSDVLDLIERNAVPCLAQTLKIKL